MTNERRVVHDTQRTLSNMTTIRLPHLVTVFLLVLLKSQNTLSLSVLNYNNNHNIHRKAVSKRTLGIFRQHHHHHRYQYGRFQNFKRSSFSTKMPMSAQSQQQQREEISSSPSLGGIEHQEGTCSTTNKNDARTIMNAILARYDNDGGGGSSNQKAVGRKSFNPAWKKTRNYLYHACSSSSSKRKRNNTTTTRTTKNPLTYQEVIDVLNFLDVTFPQNAQLIRHILQSTPRILRKPPMLLQENAQFLHDLYGPQNLFHVAISRNPTLLIVSGVTQNPQQYYKNFDNQDSNHHDDNIEQIHAFLKEELKLSATQMSKLQKTTLLCSIPYERFYNVMTFLQSILRNDDDDQFDSSNDTIILIEKRKQQQQMNKVLWKIVSCHTQIFNLSVETNLQPRIQFIQDRCGIHKSKEWIQLLKACPGILGLSVEDNLKPTIDFLSIVLTDTYDDKNQYGRKNEIDTNGDNGGNSGTEQLLLRKCLLSHPQLLALSLSNLQSKVAYFDYVDKLEETTTMRPTVSSTISSSSLASRIATKSPVIYSLSLKENIIPKINFLAKVWGAIAPRTALLEKETMNHNNYEALLRQLQKQHTRNGSVQTETQLPAIRESLSKRLKEYPNVLTLSLEGNIQPTMEFFRRTGYAALDSDFNVVDVNRNVKDQELQQGTDVHQIIPGRYIASSLFNRLLPRWHFYMQKCTVGVQQKHEQSDDHNHFLDKPPLHVLVGATDASFCEYIGCSLPELQEFTKVSAPRLKFSSQWDTWLRTGRPIDDT